MAALRVVRQRLSMAQALADPRVAKYQPRYEAQDLSNYVEFDPRGRWVAFSRFDEVAAIICLNHLRAPGRVFPNPLLRLKVVDLYSRESDNTFYEQRFKMIMCCVAPKDNTHCDIMREVWTRHKLFRGRLHWDGYEYQDAKAELYVAASRWWAATDLTYQSYMLHTGCAIEGEKFGKGKILTAAEARVEATRAAGRKGGVHVPQRGE